MWFLCLMILLKPGLNFLIVPIWDKLLVVLCDGGVEIFFVASKLMQLFMMKSAWVFHMYFVKFSQSTSLKIV